MLFLRLVLKRKRLERSEKKEKERERRADEGERWQRDQRAEFKGGEMQRVGKMRVWGVRLN